MSDDFFSYENNKNDMSGYENKNENFSEGADEKKNLTEDAQKENEDASACASAYGCRPAPEAYGNARTSQVPYGYRPAPENYGNKGTSQVPYGYRPAPETYGNKRGAQPPYGYPPSYSYNRGYQPPHGYGNPYGYQPPYIQKKGFFERVKDFFVKKPYKELTGVSAIIGVALLMHLFFNTFISSILTFSPDILDMYMEDLMFSAVFGMLYSLVCIGIPFFVIFMFMRRIKSSEAALPLAGPRKGSHSAILILAGLGVCYIGNIITSYITMFFSMFGLGFSSTEAMSEMSSLFVPETGFEFIVLLVYNAVIPAFVEEFAFRGIIMQSLRKYGDWFAIFVSAFLFGIIHGNMTQMPFAIIAGIALGYVSVVSGSMWTAVILHFINNVLAFVQMVVFPQLSEGALLVFSTVMTYGVLAAGVVAIIAYALMNRNFMRLRKGVYPEAGTGHKTCVFFLVPSTLLAVISMCGTVLADMVISSFLTNL